MFALILAEGIGLIAFASMAQPHAAVIAMLGFGLFTHMACGATYALSPFINRQAMGGIAGIIGAGGNVGAVAAGFLMKGADTTQQGLLVLGTIVTASAACALAMRFSESHRSAERLAYADAIAARKASDGRLAPEGALS